MGTGIEEVMNDFSEEENDEIVETDPED